MPKSITSFAHLETKIDDFWVTNSNNGLDLDPKEMVNVWRESLELINGVRTQQKKPCILSWDFIIAQSEESILLRLGIFERISIK